MAEGLTVGVECPWCGPLNLKPSCFRCASDLGGSDQALCEFDCPQCFRLVLVRTTATGARLVLGSGGAPMQGAVPFELLEAHDGPPLTLEDLLDFHNLLEASCCPKELAA